MPTLNVPHYPGLLYLELRDAAKGLPETCEKIIVITRNHFIIIFNSLNCYFLTPKNNVES